MATITGKKLTIDGYTFDLSDVAPLASPSFTGTPTAPTAASGTNTTQIATTEFVQAAVASGGMTVDSAMSSTSTNTVQNKVIKEYVESQLADLSDSVRNRLDGHDSAISKLSNYVTPEMFGAVCDGVTDDTQALQNCINYASSNAIPVKITKNIFINQIINVPSYVRIDGATHYEYYPFIIAGANCPVVFNCTGVCNIFRDFGIRNYDSNYRVLDGIVMVGDSNYNIDTEIDNVHFSTMDRCVVIKGRNVNVHHSFFGQSRIGVYFDLPSDGTQYRGLQIDNCRFHEIGSFEALNWFDNSACIWIEDNTWSNLTVRNCIADQSGTFFYGYCTNGLIENNFVEAYAKPIIDIDGVGMPANVGSILFLGNTFNGKYGQVAVDVVQPYPEHIVSIKNCGRINFSNNILRHCQYDGMVLDTVTQCSINSNVFLNTGITDSTKKTAISLTNSTYINIIANLSGTNSMKIYNAVSSSSISTANNHNFYPLGAENVVFIDNKSWVLLGDCNSQSALTFDLPKEFLVRMNDGRSSFYCHKLDNYITNGVSFSEDGKKFYALTFRFTNENIVPILRQYDTANISAPVGWAVKLYFYGLYN